MLPVVLEASEAKAGGAARRWHTANVYLQFARWIAIEAIGCVLDLGAVCFASYLVWALQMPLRKRLSVAAIFSTRLLCMPLLLITHCGSADVH